MSCSKDPVGLMFDLTNLYPLKVGHWSCHYISSIELRNLHICKYLKRILIWINDIIYWYVDWSIKATVFSSTSKNINIQEVKWHFLKEDALTQGFLTRYRFRPPSFSHCEKIFGNCKITQDQGFLWLSPQWCRNTAYYNDIKWRSLETGQ